MLDINVVDEVHAVNSSLELVADLVVVNDLLDVPVDLQVCEPTLDFALLVLDLQTVKFLFE